MANAKVRHGGIYNRTSDVITARSTAAWQPYRILAWGTAVQGIDQMDYATGHTSKVAGVSLGYAGTGEYGEVQIAGITEVEIGRGASGTVSQGDLCYASSSGLALSHTEEFGNEIGTYTLGYFVEDGVPTQIVRVQIAHR